MKKVIAIIAIVAFGFSCTPEAQPDNENYQIDKEKICPTWDRNCNGIPDNEE